MMFLAIFVVVGGATINYAKSNKYIGRYISLSFQEASINQ